MQAKPKRVGKDWSYEVESHGVIRVCVFGVDAKVKIVPSSGDKVIVLVGAKLGAADQWVVRVDGESMVIAPHTLDPIPVPQGTTISVQLPRHIPIRTKIGPGCALV